MTKLHRLFGWTVLLVLAFTAAAFAQAPATKQVEVFGQKISYVEAGSGPNVILLHGLGGDASNWAMTVPALAKNYHVYVPDQIGFGQSDKPLINYRVATLVEFLNGFCKKLGIEKASVVGNSLGGWTAAAFALAYPDKVEKLVLVDAAGYSPERWGGPKLSRETLLRLNPATPGELKETMSVVFYNKALLTDAFIEQAFAAKLKRNDGYTINQFIESVLRGEDNLDGKTKNIKAPTLVMWGKGDNLTPLAIGEAFAKDIPGAQTAFIEKCGHVPQLECAAAFNAALLKFLAGASTAQGGTK
ncbi:MAG: alpha/beta hydrolase [Blastocatellia bacterium]